jgi:pyrroloquinoline quinone biosynthesis protein B
LIRIRVLGAAAGGGLPQWNCSCPNCVAARRGDIPPQTQSSVAITADNEHWLLVNASPDLARQIESTPELQPKHDCLRNSPVAGVLLTNADVDHALGLLLVRQRDQPLIVYASEETRLGLHWIDAVLTPFCGIEWRALPCPPSPGDFGIPLSLRETVGVSAKVELEWRAIVLQNSVAYVLRDEASRRSAVIAPAVGAITAALREAINRSDLVLFDGTFWSDDELRTIRPQARRAREMNHLPISNGSFELLRSAPARRKIYIHINNTNPIWMAGSPERQQLEGAGIEVAWDGLEVTL